MGLEGELQLLQVLRQRGLNALHGVAQRRITDFLANRDDSVRKRAGELLRANRMLPRRKLTYEIDLLAWQRGHWAALAIEQKNQNGAAKVLDITKDAVVLKALCGPTTRSYEKAGRDLWLQCRGEAYLGKAFCIANDIDAEVVPVGVVDYELRANGSPADWACQRGVFFVRSDRFPRFLDGYVGESRWFSRAIASRSALSFGSIGDLAS